MIHVFESSDATIGWSELRRSLDGRDDSGRIFIGYSDIIGYVLLTETHSDNPLVEIGWSVFVRYLLYEL